MVKYSMKRIIILLLMLVFPALAYAQIEIESQQPEIKFDAETYNLGEVKQEVVTHSFEFSNTGSSELVIEKLVPA